MSKVDSDFIEKIKTLTFGTGAKPGGSSASVEVLSAKPIDCGKCGKPAGFTALLRVKLPGRGRSSPERSFAE